MVVKCRNCSRYHNFSIQGSIPYIICRCGEKLNLSEGNEAISLSQATVSTLGEKEETTIMKKELSALIEISRLLVSTFNKDGLIYDIFTVTADVMCVEAVSILLYDQERDDMAFYMSKGPGAEEITQIRLKKDEGIAGWVFMNKKSVVSEDLSKDMRFCKKVDESVQFTSKNLMAVPIFVGNEIIGVMEAVNKKDGASFSELDLKTFESIANHVGEALEKARLMEENIKSMRLAAIGQTLSSLSHCIKNILNGLSGGSYIVNRGMAEENLEMIVNGWDIVDKCIARITDLSMNMLSYSKERKPLYKPTIPNKIVEEVAQMLSKRVKDYNIEFSLDLDRTIKEIPMDSYGIFRCMLNLITNAIEACPRENGKIEVTSKQKENGNLVIAIVDNGPGIDEDKQKKIFSVFYSTKGGQGTGLGLAVSKKIIDEHRGNIQVESSPGKGTRFYFELPGQVDEEPIKA